MKTNIMKFGPVSLPMTDPYNIWNPWTNGQKMYSKQVWKLTNDGSSNMLPTDKNSSTKHNQSIFSFDPTATLNTYTLFTSWHGNKS